MSLSDPLTMLCLDAAATTGAVPAAEERGTALIVDGDTASRESLARMLAQEGFRIQFAPDGETALRLFEAERPDIVFMEVMLPGIDGVETTRQLKQQSGIDFVPVIFLTTLRDEKTLMRCTEAGGDDFVSKPLNPSLLKARIFAMERVRDLQRTVATKQQILAELLERERQEQALAERVLSHAVKNRNVAMERLGMVQRPATIFNGDLVLSQHFPDGGLRVLVGDFTGHGLAAAVGALPVADAFHAMTRKGVSDSRVLAELNRKLYQILPADRFMAACLISISGTGEELRWWNGGMPSAWLRTAHGIKELTAHALPLGILPELPSQEGPRRIRLSHGDRLLLMTDGLLEATNQDEVMFVNAGFEQVLEGWKHDAPILPALFEALDVHCENTEQADDIGAVEIPLDPELFAHSPAQTTMRSTSEWSWDLDVRDERLFNQPSFEAALRPMGLLDGLESHLGILETILAELFNNAVEHGVLKLDSSIKGTSDGFEEYYRERSQRLSEGCRGRVSVRVSYEPLEDGGQLRIQVTDSGNGFDEEAVTALDRDPTRPWGRGIPLLRSLCHSLTYGQNGSHVEAVYRW